MPVFRDAKAASSALGLEVDTTEDGPEESRTTAGGFGAACRIKAPRAIKIRVPTANIFLEVVHALRSEVTEGVMLRFLEVSEKYVRYNNTKRIHKSNV